MNMLMMLDLKYEISCQRIKSFLFEFPCLLHLLDVLKIKDK